MRSFCLLAVLAFVACRTSPDARSSADTSPVLVRITKGTCNAKCAAYEVEARESGEVSFIGRQHTRVEGAATGRVTEATVGEVKALLEALDPAGGPTKIDGRVADAQEVTVSFRGATWRYLAGVGDKTAFVESLVAELERRLEVAQWVTGAAER